MAAFDPANAVTKSALKTSKAVPELWEDEIVATYKANLVMAKLVKRVSVVGKKGDVVHFPGFTRSAASAKAAASPVTLITHTGTGVSINLDQHWHYARLIDDLAKIQGIASMRRIYTDDAGYALAKRVDDHLMSLTSSWQGGAGTATWDKAVIAGDGDTLYTSATPNANAITDAGLRKMIQKLDDADVPMDGRSLVIPPVARNTMLGINRFTEEAFRGDGETLKTGKFGTVYGLNVYVTSVCPTATGGARIGAIFHRDALVLCEQQRPRVQTSYQLQHLADLLVADMVYGAGEFRDNAGIAIAFAA